MIKSCISKDWLFRGPMDSEYRNIDLPNDYVVTIPRDENAPGGPHNGFFWGGIGNYVKYIDFEDESKRYILDIDGAYMCSDVFVNNKWKFMHPHGYTPVLIDITDKLNFGEKNKISITTNTLQTSSRWYSGAGIYRDVFLWEGGDIRLEPRDVFVTTPTLDTVKVNYEITAERGADILLKTEIVDAKGRTVKAVEHSVSVKAEEKTARQIEMKLENANVWDTEKPYLYTLKTYLMENNNVIETDERKFGIRTVEIDSERGLIFNGKPLKLKGGCIHHDHGVLGAADFPTALKRKLTHLKNVGFNAIRTAHNPPSTLQLEMCDSMGLIIMDEAFDTWKMNKGGDFNYPLYFEKWWQRDIEYMVKRDRNHPSVISYSIGNEIPESAIAEEGAKWSPLLAAEVRKYDDTRIVTSAVHASWPADTWADRTEKYFEPLDMCGYNYMYKRYRKDRERFPKRVILGTETVALNFYDSWQEVLNNDYVVGDFTWTAYDNLGEAGSGKFLWERDGVVKGYTIAEYPWRTCYQGDFDLCGFRRPQSYFRETIWVGNTEPKIFTTHPEHYGEGFTGTGWHWYDVHDTWIFEDEYLGKPVKCEVYTTADEIEWILNGRVLGRSKPEKAIATFDIPYEKGEVKVIAYKNGKQCGCSSLHTVGEACAIKIVTESDSLKADNRDLCYIDIFITDKNGDRIPDSKAALVCNVEGGELMGIFSADPKNEDQYGSNICHAFEGRAVAIVRAKMTGTLKVTVSSENLKSATVEIKKYF